MIAILLVMLGIHFAAFEFWGKVDGSIKVRRRQELLRLERQKRKILRQEYRAARSSQRAGNA